ncbi:recombinase family protein [Caldimonas mangrovi]|uniref:recombinase family protein n=1 Tax=Caldimonas mangrovi TaxID=2944811 RepID=UPI0034A12078
MTTPLACLYARYSTDKQRETSIEDQLRQAKARAHREGWTVVATHADEGVSGSVPVALRPGGKAMLADALAGRFSILILEGLDRLSRELGEAESMVKRLEHRGIRIIGTADGYDTLASGRKVMRIARGLVNELYLDDLREKTHRGLAGQMERGLHAGGKTYGYRTVDAPGGRRLVIDEEQARHVRDIFARYAAGESMRAIVLDLNARGVPSSRGGTWASSALKGPADVGLGLLNNELYVGRVVWNRRQWLKCPDTGARRYVLRPPHEWQVREAPELRIVDQAVWDAVRARAIKHASGEDKAGAGRKGGRPGRTLFGGLLRCSVCGGPVVAVNAWGYGCAAHHDRGPVACPSETLVPRAGLDTRLLGVVREELMHPEALVDLHDEVRAAVAAATASQTERCDALQRRQNELQREIDNLVQSLALVGVSAAIAGRLKAAEADLEAVKQQMQAQAVPTPEVLAHEVIAQYKRLMLDLRSALEKDTDREHTRRLLAELLGEVVVGRDEEGAYADLAYPAARLLNAAGGRTYISLVAGAGFEPTTFGL